MAMGWRAGVRGITAVVLAALVAGLLMDALRDDVPPVGAGVLADAEHLIERAEYRLIMACMRKRGLDYPDPYGGVFPTARPALPDVPSHPFGVDDIGWARTHGFGSDLEWTARRAADTARSADPVAQALAALPKSEQAALVTALYGVEADPAVSVTLPTGHVVSTPTVGCQAEARATLYGDQARWFRASMVVRALPTLAVRAVRTDVRFVRAEQAWSACMATLGHPVSDMMAWRERFETEAEVLPAPQRRELEIRLAVDEAACARRTGVTALGERLERETLQRLRRTHHASVADVERLRAQAAVRAAELLRSPVTPPSRGTPTARGTHSASASPAA
jgi:hypothetical protein